MNKLNLSMTNQLVDFVIAEKTSIIINDETISRLNRTKYNFMNQTISKKKVISLVKKVSTINGLVVKRITKMKYTLDKLTVKKNELLNLLTTSVSNITAPLKVKLAKAKARITVEPVERLGGTSLNDLLARLDKKLEMNDYIEFYGTTSLDMTSAISDWKELNQRIKGKHVAMFHDTEVLLAEIKRVVPNVVMRGKKIMRTNLKENEIQAIENLLLRNTAIGYGTVDKDTGSKIYSKAFIAQTFRYLNTNSDEERRLYDAVKTVEFSYRSFDMIATNYVGIIKDMVKMHSQDIFRDMLLAQHKKNLAA